MLAGLMRQMVTLDGNEAAAYVAHKLSKVRAARLERSTGHCRPAR
jgi:hypothetical protein